MDTINGVSIRLTLRGEELPVDEHGRVLKSLEKGDKVVLWVTTTLSNIFGVFVNGAKDVQFTKNHSKNGSRKYRLPILVEQTDGPPFVRYPANHLCVLVMSARGFVFQEIALVGQGGEFWVTTQTTYEVGLYRKGDELACPQFAEKWPQLVQAVKRVAGETRLDVASLPSVEEYVAPKREHDSTSQSRPNQARVLWFNHSRQQGAL